MRGGWVNTNIWAIGFGIALIKFRPAPGANKKAARRGMNRLTTVLN